MFFVLKRYTLKHLGWSVMLIVHSCLLLNGLACVCACTNSHTYYIYIVYIYMEKERKEKVYIVKYKQPVNLSETHMSLSGVLLTQLFHRFDNFQN